MSHDSSTKIKGTGLISSRKWITEAYGAETWLDIERALPRSTREILGNALLTNWYPVGALDDLWLAFHDRCHPSNGRFQEVMMRQGVFIAEDNLSTVYDLLLMFVRTPQQLMKIMPRLWKTYFRGVEVEIDPTSRQENEGTFRALGLGELHHISPVACGWIQFALEKIGTGNARIEEQSYLDGKTASDEMVFRLAWG